MAAPPDGTGSGGMAAAAGDGDGAGPGPSGGNGDSGHVSQSHSNASGLGEQEDEEGDALEASLSATAAAYAAYLLVDRSAFSEQVGGGDPQRLHFVYLFAYLFILGSHCIVPTPLFLLFVPFWARRYVASCPPLLPPPPHLLSLTVFWQVESLERSLDELLTRVDEFVGMLDMVRGSGVWRWVSVWGLGFEVWGRREAAFGVGLWAPVR